MAILAGRHRLDTDSGRILLTTARDGLAAQAGHDLTIEPTGWSGDLEVGADLAPVSLEVRVDLASLVVREGSGGLKTLTERDKQEIATTARKVLSAQRHPAATFSATGFRPDAGGGGVIDGTLTVAGRARPLRLDVRQPAPGTYVATGSVTQSEYGIKPYSAFLGSLKVRDAVGVRIEVSLPEAAPGSAAPAGDRA
jgi:polyisoprenoid-binding protein YceI